MENQTKRRCATSAMATTTTKDSTNTGCKRPRKGRLESIMEMPVDVFSDIAKNLAPDDLLRLARSSKALRDVLMSRNSTGIWKAAEEGIGLPDCPSDLSSPQYASLLFDTFCMDCEASGSRVRHSDYTLSVFRCPYTEDYYQATPGVKLHQLVPCSIIRRHCTSDLNSIDESSIKHEMCAFYKKEVDATVEKYLALGPECERQQAFLSENRDRILRNAPLAVKIERMIQTVAARRANLFELLREFVYLKIEPPADCCLFPSAFFNLSTIDDLLNRDGFDEAISPEILKTVKEVFFRQNEKLKYLKKKARIDPPDNICLDMRPRNDSIVITHMPSTLLIGSPNSGGPYFGTLTLPPRRVVGLNLCALQQILIATLRGRQFVLSNSDTPYRHLLESRFICYRCEDHERVIMSWEDLVVHFLLKNRIFKESQGFVRTSDINQHDIDFNRTLAVYVPPNSQKRRAESSITPRNIMRPIFVSPGIFICRCAFCEKVPIGFFILEVENYIQLPGLIARDYAIPMRFGDILVSPGPG
ncbi:hypothetical protein EW145_g3631 [Phellinidium pouzarii]|uniref:F-box domain-containing protein n=1 Tax=Phellinidium pouzarii TaxID=167371 RepID=A0A4S4L6F5_9AGAM|nr:hypothetical protein EW145_g3631 [Phellinidium pouzarii]